MLSLIAVIIPLALLDSLNPVTIAVHVYLLGTPRPQTRSLTFIVGIFVAYVAGGLILAAGLNQILAYFTNLTAETWNYLQMAAGMLLLAFAGYLGAVKIKADKNPDVTGSIKSHNTFWLGFVVTATDLPTAVPYIAAIEQILQAQISNIEILTAVLVYNLIYLVPLFALFGIYLLLGGKSERVLGAISKFINRWSNSLMMILCLVAGLIILANSVLFFFGYSFF